MPPEPTSPPAAAARLRLVVASLAVLLAAADTYVVVLAIPEIVAGIGLDPDELNRAAPLVSAFLLGYVVVLPLVGRITDLVGREPVLLAALVVFAAGSLLTATADGLGAAVTGRALQGLGGGALVPATLALVADLWPAERRGLPLGAVGAVQELGAVLGPLAGAGILAVSGWRAIFWANLAGALVLAAGLVALAGRGTRRAPDLPSLLLATVGIGAWLLALLHPRRLTDDVTWGSAYDEVLGPLNWLELAAVVAVVLLTARQYAAAHPLLPVRRLPTLARAADLPGAALLGLGLAGIVLTFAEADPERRAVSSAAPYLLTGSAVALALFVLRQRRARRPLVPRGTLGPRAVWGALLTSLLVGSALIAVLVDVPVFARVTRHPGDQLAAALVLLRFLAAVPVGALAGGWLTRRWGARVVAGSGMALAAGGLAAMASWERDALAGAWSDVTLALCGLGFGLAIAPVNAAALAAARAEVHGLVSGLVVVARTIGMLVGLSALTAVGLRAFYAREDDIPSPFDLCPQSPSRCPEYRSRLVEAVVDELQVVFLGAALCALLAAVAAVLLLVPREGGNPEAGSSVQPVGSPPLVGEPTGSGTGRGRAGRDARRSDR